MDDLLAARIGVAVHQCFSPNVKPHQDSFCATNPDPTVVAQLKRRGVLFTDVACACLFLQRYAPVMRDYYGGVALAFLDVFGGCAPPVFEISLRLRLFEPRGALLTFAASHGQPGPDFAARFTGRLSVETYLQDRAGRLADRMKPDPDVHNNRASIRAEPKPEDTTQVYGWEIRG